MTSASVDGPGRANKKPNLAAMLSKSIYFVQTEDGTIPSTFYMEVEDAELINIVGGVRVGALVNKARLFSQRRLQRLEWLC